MKAEDVIRCLNNRFCAPEWVFLSELSMVPGFIRGRRADAIALNCWTSGKWGLSFLGFEIKVSRGDFLHELKHPKKRLESYPDVDGIFFAVPKGLVRLDEVPADCGLIECWIHEGLPDLLGKPAPAPQTMTKIKKYPEGFKTAMDHMEKNASANLHLAPPISRAVAVAVIRAFDPDRINQDTWNDARMAKEEARRLKHDMRWKLKRLEELEAQLVAKEWTKVEDGLPPAFRECLVALYDGTRFNAWHDGTDRWLLKNTPKGQVLTGVRFWHLLPESPC